MSSWKRPVVIIVGVALTVDILMVTTGMGPQVVLVAALGCLVGAGVWFVADLADTADGASGAQAGPWSSVGGSYPQVREPEPRADRRVRQLRTGLAYGRPDRASLVQLRTTLVELIDDQLRAAHLIDRTERPDAARAIIGDDLYGFVTDPDSASMLTEPRKVDHIVTLIERI